jgi:hypothetical protein
LKLGQSLAIWGLLLDVTTANGNEHNSKQNKLVRSVEHSSLLCVIKNKNRILYEGSADKDNKGRKYIKFWDLAVCIIPVLIFLIFYLAQTNALLNK